jgi:mono/diheme cytochrome c family protein
MKKVIAAVGCLLAVAVFSSAGLGAGEQADPGKLLVQTHCVKCHTLKRVKGKIGHADAKKWEELVTEMVGKGAQLTPDEQAAVVKFLAAQTSPAALD